MNLELKKSFEILQSLSFQVCVNYESAELFSQTPIHEPKMKNAQQRLIHAGFTMMILKTQCFIDEFYEYFNPALSKLYAKRFEKEQKQVAMILKSVKQRFDIREIRNYFIAHGYRSKKTNNSVLNNVQEYGHLRNPVEMDDRKFIQTSIHQAGKIIMDIEYEIVNTKL